MARYGCTVHWMREGAPFTDLAYGRGHEWRFDGGAVVRGSSSPHSVRVPWSDPAGVDPEEALVASVASCHMLWFLGLAAEGGFVIDSYTDAAEGTMGRFPDGRTGITQVLLQPALVIGAGATASDAAIEALHHAAHEHCYIANSIRGVVRVQGRWRVATSKG